MASSNSGKVIIKIEQSPACQILLQDLSHQVDFEEGWKYLVVEVSGKRQPLIAPFGEGGCIGRRELSVSDSNEVARCTQGLDTRKSDTHGHKNRRTGQQGQGSPISVDEGEERGNHTC